MKKELELYLHIPFCVKKCAYCDFLSASADESARREYVEALIREIQGYKETYRAPYQATTIFIGGGTPSILTGTQITEIFDVLRQSFRIAENAEITIEANPGTVTEEKLRAWKMAGINRLSIGLQSADNEELKELGRIHTWEEFLETYGLARAQGFENINIDLISAIPGQTEASWENTLTRTARLNPEHISAYSLIIEEDTPFYEQYGEPARRGAGTAENTNQISPLPDEDTERAIYEMTEEILHRYGYQRYEISNYAKKGYACRHNQGYWERKEYLGIGLGASSLIGRRRYHNTEDIQDYIKKVQDKIDIKEDEEHLSQRDEIEEFMFLGLRETKGVSISRFRETFGQNIYDVYATQLKKLEENGLLAITGDHIRLTNHGINISNMVFVEFLGEGGRPQ